MAINQPSTLPAKSTERLGEPGRLDALTLLVRDHRAVQQAFNDYQRFGDPDVIRHVIEELATHEQAEERAFWPRVRELLPNGEQLANACIMEEVEATQLAAELNAADPSWTRKLERLMTLVLNHAHREELEVFQPLRTSVPVDELMAWAEEIERARRSG